MMTWHLENAENQHRRYPSKFELPSERDRNALKMGDYAKLIFLAETPKGSVGGDRMWVQVTRVHAGGAHRYTGVLTNEPTFVRMKAGDRVDFGPEHVISIRQAN